jgi:hypothetical protein
MSSPFLSNERGKAITKNFGILTFPLIKGDVIFANFKIQKKEDAL